SPPDRSGCARRPRRQSLPLRQPQPHRARHPAGVQGDGGMNATHLNRREFGLALGGIVVAFSMSPSLAAEQGQRLPAMLGANRRLNSWLRIDPLGTVTVFTGRVELGQGNVTALAQIVA